MSSAYLRLLLFFLAILIKSCDSSSLAFPMMYSAYKVNKQSDNIHHDVLLSQFGTSQLFNVWFLTLASWPAYRFLRRQVRWSGIPISLRISHSLLWSTQRLYRSLWSGSRCFSEIPLLSLQSKQMLAIWSLVPLPFLNSACTSESSWFMYPWSLAWRLLSITLLTHEMTTLVQ